jgi:hypothetical protein
VATDPPNRAFKLCALRKEGMLDLLNSRKLNIMVKKSILRFVAIALQNYFVLVIFLSNVGSSHPFQFCDVARVVIVDK